MSQAIYVNLVVQDLPRAKAFFTALGWSVKEQFTNEDVAGIQVTKHIHVMLHTPSSIVRYTEKALVNSKQSTEVLLALQQTKRHEVDALLELAMAAGGREYRPPEDHGFMYARTFEDPDGHIWEAFWMDAEAMAEDKQS